MPEETTSQTIIHPSAVVEPGAQIGAGARIGPFCHVGPDAIIGDRVELVGHVVVAGATTLGEGTRVYSHAALGGPPQDVKHKGGRTTLTIGRHCIIRESATMNVGSDGSTGATVVGDNGFFLAYSHVAHDCVVGDNVVLTHASTLGGHCVVGNGVIVGGHTAVHQFVRIGDHAFIGGCSAVVGDVIPFALATGNRAKLRGLNVVGLRRSGTSRTELSLLRAAYQELFSPLAPFAANLSAVRDKYADAAAVMRIVAFLDGRGKRHLTVPPLAGQADGDDGAVE